MKQKLLWVLAALLALALFVTSVEDMERSAAQKGKEHLEAALRQATTACYAAEGFYPPGVAYLQEHYGIQIDEARYVVHYDAFAYNLMPNITVLEREP